jgi:hypothetical protein
MKFFQKPVLFFLWSFAAAFLAYASMYAFRKPFNAASYEGFMLFNLPLKDLLLISQILGYMLSKFIGIKVISEMTKSTRVGLIFKLILFAHVALLLFAIVPVNFKFICLFANGLPLGMVWGVIFSFLEGRKLTELLATGIAVGAIISSGIVKSIALYIMDNSFYSVPEFWMPFVTGLFFLPILILSAWMLSVIPEPSEADKQAKIERIPMDRAQKRSILKKYLPGIISLVILYLMQTIFRDFRDNFSVELFGFYGFTDKSQFVSMEFIIGLTVVFTTSLIVIFKNNLRGFQASLILSGLGFVMMLVAELLFGSGQINFFYLMLFSGLGMSIGYVPFQIALFERFIAAFHIAGNVGFLMYISDSLGYLGSVSILFSKNAGLINIDNVALFHMLIFGCGIIGLIATIFSIFYFNVKFIKEKNEIH